MERYLKYSYNKFGCIELPAPTKTLIGHSIHQMGTIFYSCTYFLFNHPQIAELVNLKPLPSYTFKKKKISTSSFLSSILSYLTTYLLETTYLPSLSYSLTWTYLYGPIYLLTYIFHYLPISPKPNSLPMLKDQISSSSHASFAKFLASST